MAERKRPQTRPRPAAVDRSTDVRADGARSVAVGGGVDHATIITGDQNQVTIVQSPGEAAPPLTRATWRPWLRAQLVPKRLGAALVAVVGLASGLIALVQVIVPLLRPAPIMTGGLNVAVAQFTALDQTGQELDLPAATNLGNSVHDVLAQQLRQPLTGMLPEDVLVWPPSTTGAIRVASPAERDSAAERRARDIHADVLVFAELTAGPRGTTLQPRFYLSPRKLGDAEELVGVHAFGPPIRADGQITNTGTFGHIGGELLKRGSALGQFLLGLDYIQTNQYAPAQALLGEAAKNWEGEGKALVYLFLGHATGGQGDLNAAESYYNASLSADNSYPRARFGLAEVLYQEAGATRDCDPAAVQLDGLKQAIGQFELVAAQTSSGGLSNLSTKTQLALGSAYTCYSQAQNTDDRWDAARGAFSRVIGDYAARTGQSQEDVRDLAAEAHAGLGYASLPFSEDPAGPQRDAAYTAAAAEYQQAIDLSGHGDRRGVFYRLLSFIHARLGQTDTAASDLDAAAREDPQRSTVYQELRRQLSTPAATPG